MRRSTPPTLTSRRTHPELLLYRGDGDPQRLGDLLEITDPGNPGWQRHWLRDYGAAADALGFDGFHLDTYGYPRQPLDARGQPVRWPRPTRRSWPRCGAARPARVLSFNQVNGVPPRSSCRAARLPLPRGLAAQRPLAAPGGSAPAQRACLARPEPGAVLAIYPPVWARTGQRPGPQTRCAPWC